MKKTALIVEDDILFATLVKNILTQNGYDVVASFADGNEAIQYLNSHKVSLITMDIDLDGSKNGLETAEELRKQIDTPLLFISARNGDHVIDRVDRLSPSAFMDKFIDRHQFIKTLDHLNEDISSVLL